MVRTRRFLVVAVAAGAAACASILGIEEPTDRPVADGGAGPGVPDASSDVVAPAEAGCSAPCEGRCGTVASPCGPVECGGCGEGQTCKDGACTCPSPCGNSTCGTFTNACGQASCGPSCPEGTSCRAAESGGADGGLACRAGACIDPPTTDLCAGKCGTITSPCGNAVVCPGCDDGFCIASRCECPPRDRVVDRYVTGLGYHCPAVPGVIGCEGTKQSRTIAFYSAYGDEDLYRCDLNGRFALSLSCGNYSGVTRVTKVGRCNSKPVCGAIPLRQLRKNVGNDYIETIDSSENPSGYTAEPSLCYAWSPEQ